MPTLLRRKSRNPLPPLSHPPPSSSLPLDPLPSVSTTDFTVQYAPLRSSSASAPSPPDGDAGGGGDGNAAPPRKHHLPTPYACSPRTSSGTSPHGVLGAGKALPKSASEPAGLWAAKAAGNDGAGTSFSSSEAKPAFLSPPSAPPPSLAHPRSPHSPASVNYAHTRRSIASLYPSPALHTSSSPPNQPLPPRSPHSTSPLYPRFGPHPTSLSTAATASPAPSSRPPTRAALSHVPTQRRTRRPPPSYTILLAGARGTGKTGFVSALVEVLEGEGGKVMERDVPEKDGDRGAGAGTADARRTTIEIVEEGEKVALHLLDSEGLDIPIFTSRSSSSSAFLPLELEMKFQSRLSLLDSRFSTALLAESTLDRSGDRAGGRGQDPLVHLCLYFVCPAAMTSGKEWALGEADRECLRRLGETVHVVPILVLADTLTLPSLRLAKRGLLASLSKLSSPTSGSTSASPTSRFNLDFSAFFFPSSSSSSPEPASPTSTTVAPLPSSGLLTPPNSPPQREEDGGEQVPVVHLKRNKSQNRLATPLSNERANRPQSRARTHSDTETRGPGREDEPKRQNEEEELRKRWPFAVVVPDWEAVDAGGGSAFEGGVAGAAGGGTEEGGRVGRTGERRLMREYLHGTVDILNPSHCDFLPLRHALFGNRMEHFKTRTRLSFYEPFRTARLLELQHQQQQQQAARSASFSPPTGRREYVSLAGVAER